MSRPASLVSRRALAGMDPLGHRPLSAIAATVAGGVPQARIKKVLADLVPALAALHDQGKVHGAISVHTIGLDESGRAHLLARPVEPQANAEDAERTAGFAAFEQYCDDSELPCGPWSDIYALSAVACSLISGSPPPQALARAVRDDYTPLAQRPLPKYELAFRQQIDAGLAMSPSARPRSMQEFADRLALDLAPLQPPPAPATQAADIISGSALPDHGDGHADRTRRTHGPAAAILLALVVTALALIAWLEPGPQGPGAMSDPSIGSARESARESIAAPAVSDSLLKPTPAQAQPRADTMALPPPSATVEPVAVDDVAATGRPTPKAATPPARATGDSAPAAARPVESSSATSRPAPVTVRIDIHPWGEVFIDGVSRGVSPPLKALKLPPGKYAVTVRNANLAPYRATLHVAAGRPAVVSHTFN